MSVGDTSAAVLAGVRAALAAVDDPELPGVSILELGLLERLDVDRHGVVRVGLIPTYSGCPALAAITDDVRAAVAAVPGVERVDVSFLPSPTWTVDRVSAAARVRLAGELGVAVEVAGAARCPRCGEVTRLQSVFGATRCRAVHTCPGCGETVEVMR